MGKMITASKSRVRKKATGVVSAFAAASIVATGAFGAALVSTGSSPAEAAAIAAGYDSSDGFLGGVWLNGSIVYCIEPFSSPAPSVPDGTPMAGYSSIGLSADDAAKLNFVVSTYGQTGANIDAGATELYSWTITGQIVSYAQSSGYSGSDARGAAQWFSVRAGGDAGAVMAKYDEIVAAAAGITASPAGTGTGLATFAIDETNNYVGTLEVSNISPAGATGTITLTNGIFVETGTNIISGAGAGSYEVRGLAPEGATEYKISAVAAFSGSGSGYAGNIAYYPNAAQDVVGPGEPSRTDFTFDATDPMPRSTVFSPALSTGVGSKFYANGDLPTDVVDFHTIADASGLNNDWLQSSVSGNYAPITAKGTYYFSETNPENVQGAVPADAVVAGHAEVTTDAQGPTHSYEVTGDTPIEKSGYYTWVWGINFADQRESVQAFLPADYRFVDEYGQRAETSIIAPVVSTEAKPLEALGFPAHDTAIVEGAVFDDATVGFEAYKQEVDAETGELVGDPICTPDTLVFTSEQKEVTGPGKVDSDDVIFDEIGKYFWVEKLYYTDPDTGEQTVVHEGDCGAEGETTVIEQVIVSTKATPEVELGSPAKDTAVIRGTIPEAAKVSFSAYKQDGDQPVCTADTIVFDGSDKPVGLTPGVVDGVEYTGPAAEFNEPGKYFWVETIVDKDGKVIHEGDCGAEGETTIVKPAAGVAISGAAARLKNTGVDASVLVAGGAGVLALAAAAGAMLLTKRRRLAEQGE